MKLCFSGFEHQIEICAGKARTFEINNRKLFERVCRSLVSENSEEAVEPFVFENDEGRIVSYRNASIVIESPMSLPWDNRSLLGALPQKIELLLGEVPQVADDLNEQARSMVSAINGLALQLSSEYGFTIGWDVGKFLKAFGFRVDLDPDDSLFDNCMKFIMLADDMSLEKLLVFINLKLFLTDTELEEFFERVFRTDLHVLLIENVHDANTWYFEEKTSVDQDLLEA